MLRDWEQGEGKNTKLNQYVQAPFCNSHLIIFFLFSSITSKVHTCKAFVSCLFPFESQQTSLKKSQKTSNKTLLTHFDTLTFCQKCWPFPRRRCFANNIALQATGRTILYGFKFLKASCAIIFGFNSKIALWGKLSHL